MAKPRLGGRYKVPWGDVVVEINLHHLKFSARTE